MTQTFNNFLQEFFTKLYPSILDDELQDEFDDWVSGLDGEELLRFGELHGQEQYLNGKESILKNIN